MRFWMVAIILNLSMTSPGFFSRGKTTAVLQFSGTWPLRRKRFTISVIGGADTSRQECWKLDRECHVDFCMFLTPHELNFKLLMKTQKRKMKRNVWELTCILLFWNTVFIRSCPVVYVLYIWCRDPGLENRDSTALKNVLNEIVVNASWKHLGDMSQSGKKKLKNLRKFRDGHQKFVEKTIENAKGLIA